MAPVFASIRNRPTWIRGRPQSWSGAAPTDPGAKQLPFGFDITDDGAGFVLVCFSADGLYGADTWHDGEGLLVDGFGRQGREGAQGSV